MTAVPTRTVPTWTLSTMTLRTRSVTSGRGATGGPGQTGRPGCPMATRRGGRPTPAGASRTDPGSPRGIHQSPGSSRIPTPDGSAGVALRLRLDGRQAADDRLDERPVGGLRVRGRH